MRGSLRILTQLPQDVPGIVIVQHIPEKFTAAFAERLNGLCSIEVREAKNGALFPLRVGEYFNSTR